MANQTYTIQEGDTFWSIAQSQGVDLQQVLAANPGVDPNTLQKGQIINVPKS